MPRIKLTKTKLRQREVTLWDASNVQEVGNYLSIIQSSQGQITAASARKGGAEDALRGLLNKYATDGIQIGRTVYLRSSVKTPAKIDKDLLLHAGVDIGIIEKCTVQGQTVTHQIVGLP